MDPRAAFAALSPGRQEYLLEELGLELERVVRLELVEARVRIEELEAALESNGNGYHPDPAAELEPADELEPEPELELDAADDVEGDVHPDPDTPEAPSPPPDESGPPGGDGATTDSPPAPAPLPAPPETVAKLTDEELKVRLLRDLQAGEGSPSSLARSIRGLSEARSARLLEELEDAGDLISRPFKRGRRYRPAGADEQPLGQHGAEPRGQDAPDSPDLETALDSTAGVEPEPRRPEEIPIAGREPGTIDYEILRRLGAGAMRIPQIAQAIDRPPAEVAHHVELLKRANLVAKDRTGQIERIT